jgi:hypothetical protein
MNSGEHSAEVRKPHEVMPARLLPASSLTPWCRWPVVFIAAS